MPATFDECFQTFPALHPPQDFQAFWKQGLDALKRIPVEPRQKMLLKRSVVREQTTDVHYKSVGGYEIGAELMVPRKRGRLPCVITFHDYLENPSLDPDRLIGDSGMAHLRVRLRAHETHSAPSVPGQPPLLPAHVKAAGLEPLEKSYLYLCFLDAVRAVDYVRLQESIDPNRIGVIGRGFGASLAVFAAGLYHDRVHAVALERPGFVHISKYLAESTAPLAFELREITGTSQPARGAPRSRKGGKAKKNLEYLDCLNLAGLLKQPFFVTTGLADTKNPPAPGFALFNHLQTDKTMDLCPDEEKDPAGLDQRRKSIEFMASVLQP